MRRHPDYVLLVIIAVLLIGGFVMLSSASVAVSQRNVGRPGYYILHQLLYGGAVGVLAFLVAQRIPYVFWRKMALPGLLLALALLVLVFVPQVGFTAGGAQRWIHYRSIFFQPAEIAKLAVVVYFAAWFAQRRKTIKDFYAATLPFLIVMGIIGVLLAKQPDIGTLGIIALTGAAMYLVAGGHLVHMGLIAALGGAGLFFLIRTAPYRLNRLLVFLHPELDPKGIGYQINQALLAIGSGGIFGVGFGASRQKYNFLPEATSDSIFAVIAEELGIIGALLLLGLFLAFTVRGLRISRRVPDLFGQYLASGITSLITIQAFVNIAAITSLIPLTGVPLPFISYGGSSLVLTLAASGILVNISKHAKS